jgi:hypothetical protein
MEGNMKRLFFLSMCVAIATALASCVTPPPHPSEPSDAVPLHLVIEQVEAALGEYQANRGVGDYALPRLSTAQFDFTVTTTTTVESTADLCIFKLGGSHENDLVNEVTYTYSVPKLQSKALIGGKLPSLKDQLAQAIQSAAKAVKTETTVGGLPFNKFAVTIQYGVVWNGKIGVGVPISLVTVGLSGEKNKNTVQSVTLVFEK